MSYYDNKNVTSDLLNEGRESISGIYRKNVSKMPVWPALYLYIFVTLILCIVINLGFDIKFLISLAGLNEDRSSFILFFAAFIFEIAYGLSLAALLVKRYNWGFAVASIFAFGNLLLLILFLYRGAAIFEFIPSIVGVFLDAPSKLSIGSTIYRIFAMFTEDRESSVIVTFLGTTHNGKTNFSGLIIEAIQIYLTAFIILSAWFRGKALDSNRSKSSTMAVSTVAIIGLVILISYVVNQTSSSTSHSGAPTNSESQSTHDGHNKIQ